LNVKMGEQRHVGHLLADYVLDLLPGEERWRVEQHVAGCPQCRLALQQERRVGPAVRSTLAAATRPPAGMLSPRMPVTSRPAVGLRPILGRLQPATARPLAPLMALTLVILIFLGAVGRPLGANTSPLTSPSPTTQPTATLAETATSTQAPADANRPATSVARVQQISLVLAAPLPETPALRITPPPPGP
jgi:hypothetical protein